MAFRTVDPCASADSRQPTSLVTALADDSLGLTLLYYLAIISLAVVPFLMVIPSTTASLEQLEMLLLLLLRNFQSTILICSLILIINLICFHSNIS